ncbi:MAG TPA: 4-hydroxy-3-methylbut-2-enyl diphosphate reductase [Gemmatimonadaceae bacterium]|nr:4-hydroxy-3-methylbut-2-enyl diphosphate reductase [Gemmatimonadaceae bacterium]
MDLILAQPRGFCAGVVRAIEIVERTLEIHGSPVYVLHEIVHNRRVVEDLQQRGAIFVEDLNEVPEGSVLIFSAHGVGRRVEEDAAARGLRVLDATCPLVTKVHLQAQRYAREGRELIIVGHAGHVEVSGTLGQVDRAHVLCTVEEVAQLQVADPDQLAYVTQTTLSIDDTREVVEALKIKFPGIKGPGLDDICYATQNRQNAVRALSATANVLLVVGARNSSNSNRLREVGAQHGVPSYLIEGAEDIDPAWLPSNGGKVAITAGASTPEVLVDQVIERLRSMGIGSISTIDGVQETTTFRLPAELTQLEEMA